MTLKTANPNPYQAGDASNAAPRTRATRWMIWAGAVTLLLAVVCVISSVFGMMSSFDTIATSPTTPDPSDLANGISSALIPSVTAAPLAILGIVLMILGFVRRRPIDET